MKTKPVLEILPLVTDESLHTILNKLSEAINEVVNYGTHILKWDIEKKRKGKDNNVPSLFLRNCIELGDSISILIKESSIDPAKILIRALMESSFGLTYMITENKKDRAYSFLVTRANKDIRYYKQFIDSEKISKDFSSRLKKQNPNFNVSDYANSDEIKSVIKIKEQLLSEPIYSRINKEYNRTCNKGKKRNNNPNWYSLFDGPNNFQELCKEIDNTILYEFQYRNYSENVHPIKVLKGFVKAGNDKASLIQIRDFKDAKNVFYEVINILIDLYKVYIDKRLPEKKIDFNIWYKKMSEFYEIIDKETEFNYME